MLKQRHAVSYEHDSQASSFFALSCCGFVNLLSTAGVLQAFGTQLMFNQLFIAVMSTAIHARLKVPSERIRLAQHTSLSLNVETNENTANVN